jgi:hypothetical protein
MKRLLVLFFFSHACLYAQEKKFTRGQVEVYAESEYLYRREFVAGLNLHTNGGILGGIMGRASIARSPSRFHAISLEAVEIKGLREVKIVSNPLVPFKVNRLYVVRPMYGREYVLFRKAKDQGVQVNLLLSAGPALGLLSPYMIIYKGITVPYDPLKHEIKDIENVASATEGWPLMKAHLGLSSKVSITFEFGAFKTSVSGFEIGVANDAFAEKMRIIDDGFTNIPNHSRFTSVFVSWYFGVRR